LNPPAIFLQAQAKESWLGGKSYPVPGNAEDRVRNSKLYGCKDTPVREQRMPLRPTSMGRAPWRATPGQRERGYSKVVEASAGDSFETSRARQGFL